MYRYDEFDNVLVNQRLQQFKGQVARRLSGELTEDEFKPLRLMNGLYLQLHAYMLRVAIPYGTFNSRQMHRLAHIARKYDKGYGHFTTRQNIQYNWPKLEQVPDILRELAEVEMHAIQTSGNCIRNTTSDPFAGAAIDEVEDPRPYCEIIRQWSSLHPEFSYLPRKFKIAVTGAKNDRAAIKLHDIGLRLKRNDAGELGFEVYVGGGLGRTPMIGRKTRNFLKTKDMLSYMEAILRIYNLIGRRDNKYKARIKILLHETKLEKLTRLIEQEWQKIKDGDLSLSASEIAAIKKYFTAPDFTIFDDDNIAIIEHECDVKKSTNMDFSNWLKANVITHKQAGYAIVNISLKNTGEAPGDISADQMDVVAKLAQKYSFNELRATHEQNIVLAHVKQSDLYEIWQILLRAELANGNIGYITDMITCPGLDYCALANARSIPIAQSLSHLFESLDKQYDIGPLKLKISGCINACGHHHVGHIGLLGVDRKGKEYYQITLGGDATLDTSIGKIIGPAFAYDDIVEAVECVINKYMVIRQDKGETFLQTYRRVGELPFKDALYAIN